MYGKAFHGFEVTDCLPIPRLTAAFAAIENMTVGARPNTARVWVNNGWIIGRPTRLIERQPPASVASFATAHAPVRRLSSAPAALLWIREQLARQDRP
ncbi:hypothetical protein SBA3_1700012 [Candidatus Sulfopaludibacter sp. SbA3]|nr:hypothetical protein SBA3_1700012 [Candidatus Sulfopaludibacter sp. SbA3]